ncbi:hypothetical protein [Bradyrhizobium sp. RDI18]|uniref:hypothetical protein n=1 Tax=Bradyrhizobium sp. RDI18 TaxID=3367400 RepID=UPI003723C783
MDNIQFAFEAATDHKQHGIQSAGCWLQSLPEPPISCACMDGAWTVRRRIKNFEAHPLAGDQPILFGGSFAASYRLEANESSLICRSQRLRNLRATHLANVIFRSLHRTHNHEESRTKRPTVRTA